MYWLKQKKVIFIALAVLFLVVLFFLKNKTIFKNETYQTQNGLVYRGDEKIGDLINRDTDLDGVSDWEEGLFGTDPTKKDTNDDGVSDKVEIARRRGTNGEDGEINLNIEGSANLTQTDQLSRELFATIATLNQTGGVDQNTIDQLSSSLVAKVQNSAPRKVFVFADIKVTPTDNVQAVKNYNDSLNRIYNKYPYPKDTVIDVLQKFIIDEENVDESVLPQLDPIIKQTNNIINEVAKMDVPPSLASLHLNFLNALEKVSENINDMRLYDTDIIVAMSGVSQYGTNSDTLESAATNLANTINQRLK